MAATLSTQQAAADAVARIFRDFGHLPPADFEVGTVYPDQVHISLHGSLSDFESWREALGLAAEDIEYRELSCSSISLTVFGTHAGAAVRLIGYAPLLTAKEVAA